MNSFLTRMGVTRRSWLALALAAAAAVALVALLLWRMDLATRAEADADASYERAEVAADATLKLLFALQSSDSETRSAQLARLESLATADPAFVGPVLGLYNAADFAGAESAAYRLVSVANARAATFENIGDEYDSRGDFLVWIVTPFLVASILAAMALLILDWRIAQNRAALSAEAHSRAERAAAAKSLMLAAASHDVRQPLHALSLLLSALKRRVADDEQRGIVEKIETAAGSLRRLFSSLLDVARLEAGVVRPDPHPFALEPVLAQLVDEAGEVAAAAQGRVTLGPTPLWLDSDPQLFEAIVRNLLSNAVKASPGGEVRVEARAADGQAIIEIRDSGSGLLPAQLDAVLQGDIDPEVRVGLGLFIVREMAAVLGVTVRAAPAEGGGTAVTITGKRGEPVDNRDLTLIGAPQ
ncbi:MAG: HAMP domain-containing sensor histidine kinase [Caulobacterales bacterium]